jgi:hypothetical protein
MRRSLLSQPAERSISDIAPNRRFLAEHRRDALGCLISVAPRKLGREHP